MHRTLPILLLSLLLSACQRPPMVLPTIFAAGAIDPLADVHPAQQRNTQTLFYVTDRVYDEQADLTDRYTRFRSGHLEAGTVDIRFGPPDAWTHITAMTRAQPEGKRYRPEYSALHRFGRVLQAPPTASAGHPVPDGNEQFIRDLNTALQQSTQKAITIFVHGFKVGFEQGALGAAEYDLYSGSLGPFILYSWPSYNSLWEYSHDRDSVRFTTANARRLVAHLAQQINAGQLDAERINFIAHSSGAEVVGSVLRELALISIDQSPDERRKRWRIGSVLLIAPDISTDVARERVLKEDLRGMYDQIVVYSSVHDRALNWAARVLYRTPRIGSIHEADLTEADRYWLSRSPDVAVVDSDSSPYGGLINHAHHRFSPAVASDILLCLRSDLTPTQRGLAREQGQVIWRFADNYAERAIEAAVGVYGPINKP